MPKEIDLKGKIFGRWTVLERDFSNPGQGARWICQCSCDKRTIRSVKGQALRNGQSKSCGCLQKEIAASGKIDLTGQTFGKLTVLYQDEIHSDEAYWICKCVCGSITKPIRGSSLRNGHTMSCGCISSRGEERISNFLSKNKINFIRQFSFPDLFGDKNLLRFDFMIEMDNKKILIEFQGRQHYKDEGDSWGGDSFNKRQEYDNKKRDYCIAHGYKLIEISYQDYDNLEKILEKELLHGTKEVH